jgi:DNA-binding SARP family transcriptional activator/tetratricopeptide (TPR) repeat protein
MDDLRFRILGPVSVARAGRPIVLGRGNVAALLTGLLLSANEIVSVDALVDCVWGDPSPQWPRAALHTSLSRLRNLLGDGVVQTMPAGYRLEVDADHLDQLRFDQLVDTAGRAAGRGDDHRAVATLEAALGLWREPLLGNVESPTLHRDAVPRLTDMYLSAREDWAELCLRLDRTDPVVDVLSPLVRAHPFRERAVGHLMLALYRSGRRADALSVYDTLRTSLRDEFGIDPGTACQDLFLKVLRADPALSRPDPPAAAAISPAVNAPRQLPPGIADFTGRAAETTRIRDLVTTGTPVPGSPRIVAVAGKGGVGKTALAVQVAHRLRPEFPDGQLYVDLHGAAAVPADPGDVLADFLRAFGVTGTAIPEEIDEKATMYRSMMADRRLLVLLDNATDERQVRPLLPAGADCAVIVTSRSRFTALCAGRVVDLDVLDDTAATALLSRLIGEERVAAEPDHARYLVRLCGGLPLAVRIVGARLAARGHWLLSTLVARLADDRRRLNELTYGDLDVRTSLGLSYRGLPPRAKVLLRRVGLLDAPSIPVWAGAALLDTDLGEAADLFERLVDAQLLDVIEPGTADGVRYGCHDLIRACAREFATAEETAGQCEAALGRAFGGWLALAEQAHRMLYGGDHTVLHGSATRWGPVEAIGDRPLAWFDGERSAILATIRQAARSGLHELAWDLAWTAVTLFEARGYFDDWRTAQEQALAAAREAGNARGEAAMLTSLGSRLLFLQSYEEARAHCESALALFAAEGDRHGLGLARRNLAVADTMRGRLDSALSGYEQARRDLHDAGDPYMEAAALRGMAQVHIELGRLGDARPQLEQALVLSRSVHSARSEAQALHMLGELHLRQGDAVAAEEAFDRVLLLVRAYGDEVGEAYALLGQGQAIASRDGFEWAGARLHESLAIACRLGDRLVEGRVLLALGEIEAARGSIGSAVALGGTGSAVARLEASLGSAVARLEASLVIFSELGAVRWQARVLEALERVRD